MVGNHCQLCNLHDLAGELFVRHWNGNDDDEEVASRANVPVEFFVLVTRKEAHEQGRQKLSRLSKAMRSSHPLFPWTSR